jgi:hypothetical protein
MLLKIREKVATMSFAHFSEIYEICCEMMDEKVLVKERVLFERLDLMEETIPDPNRWWVEAVKEVHRELEKESELLHV